MGIILHYIELKICDIFLNLFWFFILEIGEIEFWLRKINSYFVELIFIKIIICKPKILIEFDFI